MGEPRRSHPNPRIMIVRPAAGGPWERGGAWAPAKLCVGRFAVRELGGNGGVGCALTRIFCYTAGNFGTP